MSLAAYQRELSAMVCDPRRRRAVALDPAAALAAAPLTRRERERLAALSRDPGMAVNTVLYRANRLSPIYAVLPLSCGLLGERLGPCLHRYWSSREIEDLQFPLEAQRFAAFVRRDRELTAPPAGLHALLDYELAAYELSLAPRRALRARLRPAQGAALLHPLLRVVAFEVEPRPLLEALERGEQSPELPTCAQPEAVLIDWREDPAQRCFIPAAAASELAHYRRPRGPRAPGWTRLCAAGLLVDPHSAGRAAAAPRAAPPPVSV